jgi:hypothetical protein
VTFPAPRTMFSLAALDNADGGRFTPEGRVWVVVRGQLWEVLGAELDALAGLGWLDLLPDAGDGTAAVRVTEKGRYWLTRWVNRNRGRLSQLAEGVAH